jgi:hypothetical protein
MKRYYSVVAKVHTELNRKSKMMVFLCSAVNFIDAEGQVTAAIHDDDELVQDDITAIKRESFDEVCDNEEGADGWYKVRWRYVEALEEKRGRAITTLICADSTREAEEIFKENQGCNETEILSVTATNIKRVLFGWGE